LRFERGIVFHVAEDNVRMDVRVEVCDTVLLQLVLERGLVLTGWIVATSASETVGSVTVDILVSVSATVEIRVEIEGIGDIFAVGDTVVVVCSIAES
jgi:hypothetical protein